jgi:hypothetical protein
MEKDNPYGDSRTIGAAKGRVSRFENTRGVKGGPKRPVASGEPAKPKKKAAKKAAPATTQGRKKPVGGGSPPAAPKKPRKTAKKR